MAVRLVTDSTSYLSEDLRARHRIAVVSLGVAFADGTTLTEDGADLAAFYARLESSTEVPTSSQPSLQSLVEAFERPVAEGDAVVGVFLSSEMSGTYESALLAANMVREGHPDAVIEVVDSRSNCMELGYAALAGARAAEEGADVEAVAAAVRSAMARGRFLFVPQTLEYLKRGGRIGGAAALLGSALQLRPVLTVRDGRTEVARTVRGRKRAVAYMLDRLAEDADARGLEEVSVHHIDAEEDALALLAEPISERLGRRPDVVAIGPVIGLHVGPGTLGVVYHTEREGSA